MSRQSMKSPRSPQMVAAVTLIALVASMVAYSLCLPGVASAALASEETGLASRVSEVFPSRQTSSYEASRLLARLAAELRLDGWFTNIQPYMNVTRTESAPDKSIVYVRVEGENLLALERPDAKELDYLIVAPYDTLFADDPENPAACSMTSISTSLAIYLSKHLDRDAREFGIAFVSGHYQYGAGLLGLLDYLQSEGISVGAYIVLGNLQASRSLPLVAGPVTPLSLVESLMAEAKSLDLNPFVSTEWVRSLTTRQKLARDRVSPDSIHETEFQGEHYLLEQLGVPVVTIGFPTARLTQKLSNSANPADTLDSKVKRTGDAIASALSTAPLSGDESFDSVRVVSLFGETRFISDKTLFQAGLAVTFVLAVITVFRLPKDVASLALTLGTMAAAALSMYLHHLFSGKAGSAYASGIAPERSLALFFVLFALMLLGAFLRLWGIRSRIHHLHERFPDKMKPPAEKTTWGSAWSLGVLAALCAGATWNRSEVLPSLLIAGIAHGIATLAIRTPAEGGRPHALILWPTRLLYLVPLVSVFWAGNPLTPEAQSVYRASWTSLNQGSLTSALSLAVVAASVFSTLRMPKPAPQRMRPLMLLCEFGSIVLIVVAGAVFPKAIGPNIQAWAVFDENYSSAVRYVLTSPAPLREIELVDNAGGESRRFADNVGLKDIPVQESREEVAWASINKTATRPADDDSAPPVISAHFDLRKQPDAIVARFEELGSYRQSTLGFEVRGVRSLLGVADAAGPDVEQAASIGDTLVAPPGYSTTFVWWRPVNVPDSLSFTTVAKGTARLRTALKALYLDQSYGGVTPVTAGVRYYQITSVVQE